MNTAVLPLPLDVRLMNWTAAVLLLGCVLALLAAAAVWVMRAPVFALHSVNVEGDLTHVSAHALRETVAPALTGNLFTVDLQAVREAFEQVPWVRRAQVRREFPGTLRVQLQEQQAAAFWGDPGGDQLVNREGEVFDADPGELDEQALPRLRGAPEHSAEMLHMVQQLAPVVAALGAQIDVLGLSPHGSWRVHLASGAAIELGSGPSELLLTRMQRLVATLARVAAQQGRRVDQLEYADLRYASGYALRLKGVTTDGGDAPGAARRPARNNQRG